MTDENGKDFNEAARSVTGNEPEWDLRVYYKGIDDPQIEADLQAAEKAADEFAAKYRGRVAGLSAAELLACMKQSDSDSRYTGHPQIYTSLLKAKNEKKYGSFAGSIDKRLTDIAEKTIFFSLELAKLPLEDLRQKIAQEPGLELYRTTLEATVKEQPYLLGEEAEKVSAKKGLVEERWVELFDKLDSETTYNYEGRDIGIEEISALRVSSDRAVREAATKAFHDGLKKNLSLQTFIYNSISLRIAVKGELRGIADPVSSRNRANNISDDIVTAMNGAIVRAYARIPHRYYEFMRKNLGVDKLKGWDRNAPLQLKPSDGSMSFGDAKKIVLDSYMEFSPRMGAIAKKMFDNPWIDARVTPGKRSGAFAMPGTVRTNPFMFMSWTGTVRDLFTLAHEMGHNIHQYLATEHTKSDIAASTPLTLAETASVFGERIVFEKLLAAETDPEKRIAMLAGKVNDMINTVMRQNAFFEFEKRFHAERREKGQDLTEEEAGQIYLDTQKAMLGDAFDLEPEYAQEWSYIPHFRHSPFYVYAYCFGDCFVNALYFAYQKTDDKEEFKKKYIAMLEAGGTRPVEDLVADFGLDIRDPSFWDGGMKAIEDLMDRLEKETAALRQKPPSPGPLQP